MSWGLGLQLGACRLLLMGSVNIFAQQQVIVEMEIGTKVEMIVEVVEFQVTVE